MHTRKEYVIYLRKSRADMEAEARGEGETLARHERALLEFAHVQGLTIVQIYREVLSGETIAARPVAQQLLSEVERGRWAGVLVMEVERLARGDTMDQGFVAQAFKFSSTKIITPMKTYDPCNEFDEEYFEFGLFMSRREYKTINRRLQQGRIASVKEGKYVASSPPFGYERVPIEGGKGFTLQPTLQADTVRMIFELYTRGELQDDGTHKRLGVTRIARRLSELGIQPMKKGSWSDSSVRDILINPVYTGKIRWNWRPATKRVVDGAVHIKRPRAALESCIVADGQHEAIIDESTFAAAQQYISANPPQPVPDGFTLKNPLAGIIKCGICGRSMNRRPYRDYPDTLICPNPGCGNISAKLHYVENRLIASLTEWFGGYKLQWQADAGFGSDAVFRAGRSAQQSIQAELATLQSQRTATHDLLEQGVYDTGTFHERILDIDRRVAEQEARLASVSKGLRQAKHLQQRSISTTPKKEHLMDVYNILPSAKAKNDLLKEVLERVVYIKATGGRWCGKKDGFELVIYPRLPCITNNPLAQRN